MSDEKKQLGYKLTGKCAVCGHALESPVFCEECGTSHCAACWFLNGKCGTYGCDNSNSSRPSIKEQLRTEQDERNEHLYETLAAMRNRIDVLERDLYEARSSNEIRLRKNAIRVGVIAVILSFILALVVTIPQILDNDPVNPPVIRQQQAAVSVDKQFFKSFFDTTSIQIGKHYLISERCKLRHKPILYYNIDYNNRNHKDYLLKGDKVQVIDSETVNGTHIWYKVITRKRIIRGEPVIEGWLLHSNE